MLQVSYPSSPDFRRLLKITTMKQSWFSPAFLPLTFGLKLLASSVSLAKSCRGFQLSGANNALHCRMQRNPQTFLLPRFHFARVLERKYSIKNSRRLISSYTCNELTTILCHPRYDFLSKYSFQSHITYSISLFMPTVLTTVLVVLKGVECIHTRSTWSTQPELIFFSTLAVKHAIYLISAVTTALELGT